MATKRDPLRGLQRLSKSEAQLARSEIEKINQIMRAPSPQVPKLQDLRRDLRRRVQSLLAGKDFNVGNIEELLKHDQQKARELVAKQKAADVDTQFSKLTKHYKKYLENRRRALELINGVSLIVTPIVLDKPFAIFVYPLGMAVDDRIETYNSWARIKLNDSKDSVYNKDARVSFFFYWRNESNYAAVITANSGLILRGYCRSVANADVLWGGNSHILLTTNIVTYLAAQTNAWPYAGTFMTEVEAETSGTITGGSTDLDEEYIYTIATISTSEFIVHEGETVIFSVQMLASYYINNGYILLDFADRGEVTCPALNIGLLSPPTVTTNTAWTHEVGVG